MRFLILFITIMVSVSCNSDKSAKPAGALDTGREFIRASLDGEFKKAEEYILKDSTNVQLFNSYKAFYQNLPEETKNNYKTAEYNINEIIEEGDSVTIINYSNTFMNRPMEIKMVNRNSEWQVDFKHTSDN